MKKFTRSAAALLAMTMMMPSMPSSLIYARSERPVKEKNHKTAGTNSEPDSISSKEILQVLREYGSALKENSPQRESLQKKAIALMASPARTSDLNVKTLSEISSLIQEIAQADSSFLNFTEWMHEGSFDQLLEKLHSLTSVLNQNTDFTNGKKPEAESAGPDSSLMNEEALYQEENLPLSSAPIQPEAQPSAPITPVQPQPVPAPSVPAAEQTQPVPSMGAPYSGEFEPADNDFTEPAASPTADAADQRSDLSDSSTGQIQPAAASEAPEIADQADQSEQDFSSESAQAEQSGLGKLVSSTVYAAQVDPEIQARQALSAPAAANIEAQSSDFEPAGQAEGANETSSGDIDFEPADVSSSNPVETITSNGSNTIYTPDPSVSEGNDFEDPDHPSQNPGTGSSAAGNGTTGQNPSSNPGSSGSSNSSQNGGSANSSGESQKPDSSTPENPDSDKTEKPVQNNPDTPGISDDYDGPDWDIDYVGPPVGVKPGTPDNPSSDSANPNVGDQPAQFPKPGDTFVPQPDNSYYDPSMPGSPFDVVEPGGSFTDPSLPPGSFTWVNPDYAVTSPVITGPSNTVQVRRLMTVKNRKVRVGKLGIINLLPDYADARSWKESTSPYNVPSLWGQCTWFAWGRFYELYGFSPKFYGNGYECVSQLLAAHSDKFEFSKTPKAGAVFSSDYAHNHVGIVLDYNEKTDTLTIQEGNLDGISNTNWDDAIADYRTIRLSSKDMQTLYGDVSYAVPKSSVKFVGQAVPESASLKKVSGKIETTLKNLKSLALERIEQKVFVKPEENEWN